MERPSSRGLLPSPPPFTEMFTEEGTGSLPSCHEPPRLAPESQRRVPSSVATSGHGGGLGWRPLQRRDDGAKALAPAPPPLCAASPFFLFLITLAACGGGGGAPPPELGTLAYVETECRATSEGYFSRQALRVRQGEREPVTVFETPGVGPLTGFGPLCVITTSGHLGDASISREAFQAVSVSPDGTSVVFEVTDEFSVNPPLPLNLPPEQKGIFWVRADGTGLRRLGPPSRTPFFFVQDGGTYLYSPLSFSPNGRAIAFVDKGPDADGHEADQVVTLDVATGTRAQVTRLPPATPPPGWSPDAPTAAYSVFIDERTISFYSSANPGGLNPDGAFVPMKIKTDGADLEVPLPIPIALPGGTIELRFVITGDKPQALTFLVPGKPTNNPPLPGPQDIIEVFAIDQGKNILQLTNFRRLDTWLPLVDVDRERIYFRASADPLGTNQSENCQLFSINRTGADLRQLTNFGESEHSSHGCYFYPGATGCAVQKLFQDRRNRSLVFYSDCDPLGTNPNGSQVFSMRPDGSELRQLTDSRGLVFESDAAIGELPGPWAYGPYAP